MGGSLPVQFAQLKELDTCALSGNAIGRRAANRFACPLPDDMPAACASVECDEIPTGVIVAIVVPFVALALGLTGYAAYRMHKRHSNKLLKEVATVMSDLKTDKPSVVIVDGKKAE